MSLAKPSLDPDLAADLTEEGETWIIQVGTADGQPETNAEIIALEAELEAISGGAVELGSHGHTHYMPLSKIDETHAVLVRLLDVASRTHTRVHHEFPMV